MKSFLSLLMVLAMSTSIAMAETQKWVTTWVGSVQGPYPVGNPSAQPNQSVVFPEAKIGANNQSFRLLSLIHI